MKTVNLILIIHKDKDKVLMCHRQKDPYKGKYNFVGGKLENDESNLSGAYRELYEETGISQKDVEIKPLFFTQYFEDALELQVYYGYLKDDVTLKEEIHPLLWVDMSEDFRHDKFAGHGNIEHMISILKLWHYK
ncbi:MAG TPA: NUDIX domain-containing protein [Erysipelothrix sp.]|nr:NUDIX domain-containing protein [Erysipelothrix sp.]